MYHVTVQGVDEHMINVHYYYYVNTVVTSPNCTTERERERERERLIELYYTRIKV